jgi:Uma2 family endonuclease
MIAVSTSPLLKTYTLEEFWALPEPEDHSKLELIAGVLYMTPPPENRYDNVVSRLNRRLTAYLIIHGDPGTIYVPRAAIWTSPNTYLEPDLFYLSAELEAQFGSGQRFSADLVVEVISPGSAIYDRNTKADTYGALGVRELWLIDTMNRTVEIRRQADGGFGTGIVFSLGQTVQSGVFPDLELPVAELFQ